MMEGRSRPVALRAASLDNRAKQIGTGLWHTALKQTRWAIANFR